MWVALDVVQPTVASSPCCRILASGLCLLLAVVVVGSLASREVSSRGCRGTSRPDGVVRQLVIASDSSSEQLCHDLVEVGRSVGGVACGCGRSELEECTWEDRAKGT